MERNKRIWGFLRETKENAVKAGVDKDTGLIRTGLDEYRRSGYFLWVGM